MEINARDLRTKMTLYKAKDSPVSHFDTKRTFSKPVELYGKILPVGSARLQDDINSFGIENAISHRVLVRAISTAGFNYIRSCDGRFFKILSVIEDERNRFLTLNCVLDRAGEKSEIEAPTRWSLS